MHRRTSTPFLRRAPNPGRAFTRIELPAVLTLSPAAPITAASGVRTLAATGRV